MRQWGMATPEIYGAAHDWLQSGPWSGFWRRAVVAAAIVGSAFLLVQLLRMALDRARQRFVTGAPLIYIVEQIGGYVIMIVGVVAGVSMLGVDLSSLAVFAGATGVGLGLGLQGVVKEFVSGLVLIFDPAIQIGDFIEVDGDVRGEVVEIGPRATRLRTNDNLNVVIPNSIMTQSRVTNWTYNEQTRRIHVPFSVAEEADKALVRDVVMAAAKALPFTLPDDDLRKTQVWLTGFDANGLDFELVVWPSPLSSRHTRTMHAAYTWEIHEALRAAGIENSTPQMDVSLRSLFGREGEHAFHALNLAGRAPKRGKAARTPPVPNDAAAAVYEDADRQRRQREADPPTRDRKS
ncbi:MAG: mechanosensitive ion channel family protein [Phenylobacterium sp.]